jgi:hypothetical protein
MRSLELSIGWGGTADYPSWRIALEEFDTFEHASMWRGEWAGRGSTITEAFVVLVMTAVARRVELTLGQEFTVQPAVPWEPHGPEHSGGPWEVGPFDE